MSDVSEEERPGLENWTGLSGGVGSLHTINKERIAGVKVEVLIKEVLIS